MNINIKELILIYLILLILNYLSTYVESGNVKRKTIVEVNQFYHTEVKYSTRRGTGLRDVSSMIYFPSNESPNNSGIVGEKCITFNGRIGSCQKFYTCKTFGEGPVIQTQLLVNCGQNDDEQLICCPDKLSSTTPKLNPTTHKYLSFEPLVPEISNPNPTQPIRKHELPKSKEPIEIPPLVVNQIQFPTQNPTTTKIVSTPKDVISKPSPTPKDVVSTPSPTPSSKVKYPINTNDGTDDSKSNYLESQEVCGIYNNSRTSSGSGDIWPWIVSIGHRAQNGTIHWTCLGSLITREYILTAAICLQREPNVIGLGVSLLGPMSKLESKGVEIRPISQVMIHEKFIKPYLYKNIGLVEITPRITVSSNLVPICFPFLASVLDILNFSGTKGTTIGFIFPVEPEIGIQFEQIEFRILRSQLCNRVFGEKRAETNQRYPYGIKSDNMCGIKKEILSICQAPGAPLVIFDEASSSFVQIGISSGDPTCAEFNRQLVTFTRLNSFSTWIRERVGIFPTPPPCYY